MGVGEIFQFGVIYVGMPILGVYAIYEFIKLLILSYKDKQNGKS